MTEGIGRCREEQNKMTQGGPKKLRTVHKGVIEQSKKEGEKINLLATCIQSNEYLFCLYSLRKLKINKNYMIFTRNYV